MVNNVIGVVNYVIAARPSLLNFMIADRKATTDPDYAVKKARVEHLYAIGTPIDVLGPAGHRPLRLT